MVQYVSLTSNWREEKGYAKCECGCIAQERDHRGAKEFRMPVEKYATFCLSLHLCSDNVRIDRVIMEQYTVKWCRTFYQVHWITNFLTGCWTHHGVDRTAIQREAGHAKAITPWCHYKFCVQIESGLLLGAYVLRKVSALQNTHLSGINPVFLFDFRV